MDERLEMAGEIIKSFCLAGIDITMNQFNKNNGLAPQKNKDDNEWLAINDKRQLILTKELFITK